MNGMNRQQGVALFTVVFLIVVVGLLGVTLAFVSGQQQLTSAQTLDQTRAQYAARARLEREIADVLDSSASCPSTPETTSDDVMGFQTVLVNCQPDPANDPNVSEGGFDYTVYSLEVRASRGNQRSGTLVQRTLRAQVTDAD